MEERLFATRRGVQTTNESLWRNSATRRSVDLQPHPTGVRNALGRAPEVGHQVAIGEKDATGFAETDEHVLGKEVRVVGITQGRLRPGVEDHGLVVGIKVRQVLRQSDVYALRLVPEVVDRRNPPVGEGDGRTDLTTKLDKIKNLSD